LATTQGHEVVACLIYRLPLDEDEWRAAAERAVVAMSQGSSLEVSLLGQAKNQRIDVGKSFVTECYALQDGRKLFYKHVHGHFSNPNAYACAHTLNFLSEVVRDNVLDRKSTDLLELYCGNGNHTVALAPLFRGALAVEINPVLVAAAAENLAANDVTNCAVQVASFTSSLFVFNCYGQVFVLCCVFLHPHSTVYMYSHGHLSLQVSPSAKFCSRILQHQQWTHAPSGQTFEFGAVLVDPPRSGLDAPTLELVCRYKHVLYISCNPFVSLRRDLDGFLAAGLSLRRLALIDHFPYTPHTECAVYLSRP
jgi:tRNA (uracil-5-)-methyltransferase